MLKSRVLTSIVLAALVVSALLLLPPMPLTLVLAVLFFGIGGWESARLGGLQHGTSIAIWIAALTAAAAALIWALHLRDDAASLAFGAATAGWAALALWLQFPDRGRPPPDGGAQAHKLVLAGLILLAGFSALAWLHALDPRWVICLILIIAGADIGAYFTGPRIGGPKLAPRISPGKTWSGVAGGTVAAVLVALVAAPLLEVPLTPLVTAGTALALVAVSIVGDLVISLMKRHRGLKDTSSLLPGHGGLLDRIDSLGAAAPVFALVISLARH